jgi:hypothetical protein
MGPTLIIEEVKEVKALVNLRFPQFTGVVEGLVQLRTQDIRDQDVFSRYTKNS